MNDLVTQGGAQTPAKREPINMGISGHGLVPTTYNELMQMAALLFQSGLAPKSLDDVQKVAVAAAMCIELGRPLMTGIQDFAVINGRVGMYGDATLAQIRGSGQLEVFEQWEEGTPLRDDWIVFTKVKRRGEKEKVASFSWLEAKRAGYDNPTKWDRKKEARVPDYSSPWRRYTRRMMEFKSRNFILRDTFGDILKGIRATEDLYDVTDLEPGVDGAFAAPAEEQSPVDRARAAATSTNGPFETTTIHTGPEDITDGLQKAQEAPPVEEKPRAKEPAPKATTAPRASIECPRKDGKHIIVSYCEDECGKRNECGSYQKFLGAQAPAEAEAPAAEENTNQDVTGPVAYYILDGKKVVEQVLAKEEVLAKINAMRSAGIESFIEHNNLDAIPMEVADAASRKYDRLIDEQDKANAAKEAGEAEAPPETEAEAAPQGDDPPEWAQEFMARLQNLQKKKVLPDEDFRRIVRSYGYTDGANALDWITKGLTEQDVRDALEAELVNTAAKFL